MSSVFKPTVGYSSKPKRNPYDMSYTNNFTLNYGTLYPVYVQEVDPGDSISISANFGLRAQPMVFPIQTRIRADIHFFYVRNRTLHDDWMDFYGHLKDIEHPYIDRPVEDFKTGSIYDYLGLPTTIMSGVSYSDQLGFNPYNFFNTWLKPYQDFDPTSATLLSELPTSGSIPLYKKFEKYKYYISSPLYFKSVNSSSYNGLFGTTASQLSQVISDHTTSSFPLIGLFGTPVEVIDYQHFLDLFQSAVSLDWNTSATSGGKVQTLIYCTKASLLKQRNSRPSASDFFFTNICSTGNRTISVNTTTGRIVLGNTVMQLLNPSLNSNVGSSVESWYDYLVEHGYDLFVPVHVFLDSAANSKKEGYLEYEIVKGNGPWSYNQPNMRSLQPVDASTLNSLPWCGKDKVLHVSALPYRAYEAIYNSYYRNEFIDPLRINGEIEYNKFVSNRGNGADGFPYQLYNRSWELDYFTSAKPSPQQGDAPLVGVTVNNADSSAVLKFRSMELEQLGIPNGEVEAKVSMDTDGTLTGISYYDENLPKSTIQRLMSEISTGISINDFRNVNAFQRWLEKNIRRGYRYKDQMKSHFGVNLSFNELLMPEFIGGVSKDVNVTPISQTAGNETGVLGELGGQASALGKTGNRIHKYCDETGFIIGICSIVPIPVYSQTPASHAFKHELFDYYFTEFGKIGMQPIFNYELTPLQCEYDKLHDVFGYQRPYGQLISRRDEAHGEFRTTATGYLLHRMFLDPPKLNANFITINNDHLNDVFAITDEDVSNQYLGCINFSVSKKSTIPLHGEPSLEPSN